MKLSISNLAWGAIADHQMALLLQQAGIEGVEIAPTLIWPQAPEMELALAHEYSKLWAEHGIEISGIQSLLFGHPELQLLQRECWPQAHMQLRKMIEIGGALGADVAVLGSPRNRIKGQLGSSQADAIAAEFLAQLVPVLSDNNIVLTLEPNAPEYGADYLTHYGEAVALAELCGTRWIQPQLDTGCLTLVHDDLVEAARMRMPEHVHASAPHLQPLPGDVDHDSLAQFLDEHDYQGWVVLEALLGDHEPTQALAAGAAWLSATYGRRA